MAQFPDLVAGGTEFLEDGGSGFRIPACFQRGPVAGDYLRAVGRRGPREQLGAATTEFRVAVVDQQLPFFEREVGGQDSPGRNGVE